MVLSTRSGRAGKPGAAGLTVRGAGCGLDHVLFHFSQIPFLAVMRTLGYRAYQAARRASLQKPQTVVPGNRAQMNNLYRSSSWQRLF